MREPNREPADWGIQVRCPVGHLCLAPLEQFRRVIAGEFNIVCRICDRIAAQEASRLDVEISRERRRWA